MSRPVDHFCPIRIVGNGTPHHFFGYYNKSTWDRSGRYLLSNRVAMMTADLTGKEVAEVGFFDVQDGDRFISIGETTTWNWQMGCQLQWLETKDTTEIIYNVRSASSEGIYPDFRCRIYDLATGRDRTIPMPVYVVAPSAEYALSVDYSRFLVTHKTIGYFASHKEPVLDNASADDGIYRLELASGKARLIVSLLQLREFQPVASMDKAIHWVTHLEIAPDSSRFLFIHRWTERVEDETCFLHRLFTVNPDGSDLRLLECTDHPLPQLAADFDPNAVATFDYEKSKYQISHPAWKDEQSVIVWGPHDGSIHYHLYNERDNTVEVIGKDTLTENGHMTYSRDGRWILTDTYPDSDTNVRLLQLFDTANTTSYNIGEFFTPPDLGKHNRCDLHPRFSPDNRYVTIDSVHEGSRQQYIVDVSDLVCRSSDLVV